MSSLKSIYLVTTIHEYDFPIEPLFGKPWQRVMNAGIKCLDMVGMNHQPGSGTLLGLVREEDGHIHHDTDIDIDVFVDKDDDQFFSKLDDLMELMSNCGFKLVRTQIHENKWPMQIAFIHEESKVVFDLCMFYNKYGDGDTYYNVYEHGIFVRPGWSVKETMWYPFNDYSYTVPKELDRYLTGRYGEWRTPKQYKDSGEADAADYLIKL